MSTFQDIFNPVGAKSTAARTNSEIYKVSFKDGKNGVYKSVIRFVPFVANSEKCIMEKQTAWVKNPVTNQGMYVDDPRTLGQFSPIADMFFKLYNTKKDDYVKLAKECLSTRTQYASIVQIIKDEQHPELEGQLKVFVYGQTIWNKLNKEQYPDLDPLGNPVQGINPFHPITGRYFVISCKEKSGFNNFDDSYFATSPNGTSMCIPGATGAMEPVTAQTNPETIINYLSTKGPDLFKYDYQPWSDDQTKFVNEVIDAINNFINTGTFRSNMQTLNAGGIGMPVASPVFPGVGMQAQSQMQPVGIPAQQAPTSGMPLNMGGFTIGQVADSNIPDPVQTAGISGMTFPEMNNAPTQSVDNPAPGMGFANIDAVLANI